MVDSVKLGGAYVDLTARLDKLEKDFKTAKQKTKETAGSMRKTIRKISFDPVAKSLGSFMTKLTSMRGVMLGAIGVGGLGMMVSSVAEATDTLAKTADRLGLTTQALAGLRHSAELTGAGVKAMEMGLQRMTRRVAEAAQGLGEARGALETLNLDARYLASISPDQAFLAIADAMAKVQTDGERVRLTFKLFDSEGVRLKNTMMAGRAELEKYTEEAKRLGVAVDREGAAKIEVFNDAVYTAGLSVKGLFTQGLIKVAPELTKIAKAATEMVVQFKDEAMLRLPMWFSQIKEKMAPVAEGLKNLFTKAISVDAGSLAESVKSLGGGLKILAAVVGGAAFGKLVTTFMTLAPAAKALAAGAGALLATAKAAESYNEGKWSFKGIFKGAFERPEDKQRRDIEEALALERINRENKRLAQIGATAKRAQEEAAKTLLPPPMPSPPKDYYITMNAHEQRRLQMSQAMHDRHRKQEMAGYYYALNTAMPHTGETPQKTAQELDLLESGAKETMNVLQESAADSARSMSAVFQTGFFNPMSENFMNLKNFGSSILNTLMSQVSAAASKMLMSGLFGGDFMGGGGSIGGIFGKLFKSSNAYGGIVDGPMSGYPVRAHGKEAIIPLNGSQIPVVVKDPGSGKGVEQHFHQSNQFTNFTGSEEDQMAITSRMKYSLERMMEMKANEAINNRMR